MDRSAGFATFRRVALPIRHALAGFASALLAASCSGPSEEMVRGVCASSGKVLAYSELMQIAYDMEKDGLPADQTFDTWRRSHDIMHVVYPRFDLVPANESTRPEVMERLTARGPSRYVTYIDITYQGLQLDRMRHRYWFDACGQKLASSSI